MSASIVLFIYRVKYWSVEIILYNLEVCRGNSFHTIGEKTKFPVWNSQIFPSPPWLGIPDLEYYAELVCGFIPEEIMSGGSRISSGNRVQSAAPGGSGVTRDSVEVSLSMFIISGRFWCDKGPCRSKSVNVYNLWEILV